MEQPLPRPAPVCALRRRNSVILAACLCASAAGCARPERVLPEGPREVKVSAVKAAAIPNEVSGFGTLSFVKKNDISAPADSVVAGLPFREGDSVRAGSVVAVLENAHIALAAKRAENALAQAAAAVALARINEREGLGQAEARIKSLEKSEGEYELNRRELEEAERKQGDQERLFAAGGVTEETIRAGRFSLESKRKSAELAAMSLEIARIGLRDEDLSRAGYALPKSEKEKLRSLIELTTASLRSETRAALEREGAARVELESSRLALEELRIKAPISGTVAARYFEVGDRVKSEDKILTLIEVDSLYAVFSVSEAQAFSLSRGMKAIVRIDALNAEFKGKVEAVSPTADAQSASFSVRVKLGDSKKILKPGMFARVTVSVGDPRKVLTASESALADKRGDDARVFVVKSGCVMERRVELGERINACREIKKGLSLGEVIVERPEVSLREGERVIVVE